METFLPIFNQTLFLLIFILLGYIFAKGKFVPDNAATTLSRLETLLFVPALVAGTFVKNCTVENLSSVWKVLLAGLIMVIVLIPVSIPMAKLCFKENYLQKIATYGLAFSNFAFMGNAVMSAVYPEIFFEYTVFTLPFWVFIYLWGTPVLLIGGDTKGGKTSIKSRMKAFLNPMLIGMLIGAVIGLTGIKLPRVVLSVVDTAGGCMSPVAMLLTGMTVAKLRLAELLKNGRVYLLSAIKLVGYPLLYVAIALLLSVFGFSDRTILLCGLCVATMPTGLNSIVVPASYGKDTKAAASMALLTHVLSVLTIPLAFWLFQILMF
ncbi:MAG: AEC family transporter [Clostridia bacterium]|nr:AEC family transporter [Clostridia bacterium]